MLKICDEKVTTLLRKHIKGSEGTATFLEMVRMILDSFLNSQLEPLERIHKIWYAIFMIRMWREFVNSSKNLTMKHNFLTTNCYACIELNAHSLVHIMLQLRDMNKPQLFLPVLFASQPCEATFRQVRSFTSTYSTVVNCTVKEILERITKIQLQNNITHNLSDEFEFPRLGQSKSFQNAHFELPSKDQIFNEIMKSKKIAINNAKKIGLFLGSRAAENVQLPCKLRALHQKEKSTDVVSYNELVPITNLPKFRNTNLRNYAYKFINESIDETGPYVEVYNSRGKRIVVRKVTLCSLLRKDSFKLSSDRMERVKTSSASNRNPNKKKPIEPICVNAKKKSKCLHYGYKKAIISLKK